MSNPATLREALTLCAKVALMKFCKRQSVAVSDLLIRKVADEAVAEVEALAASGTEAAPSDDEHAERLYGQLPDYVSEKVSVDEFKRRIKSSAQAAASPEGEGREAWEVAPGTEGDNWGIRRVGEDSGMSIAQMLWERDARHIVEIHNAALRQPAPAGREATCFAIAALEPERIQSTEYKTGFIDAKNFALELVQRQTVDSECICSGNWRKIVAQTEPLMGRHYSSVTGAEFVLEGLVHTEEDYYYGMRDIKTGKWALLSCVGSIEGHGFIPVAKK